MSYSFFSLLGDDVRLSYDGGANRSYAGGGVSLTAGEGTAAGTGDLRV